MAIVTIGLDLAKAVFQIYGVDETGRAIFAASSGAGRSRGFSGPFRHAGSAWKPAARPTTGRVGFPRWDTMSA